jgi:hypothetical protein
MLENALHLKAELPRPCSYLLHGFKTTPESIFSFWVKSAGRASAGESRKTYLGSRRKTG